MQRLEVSCAVRRIYTSLGAKGLKIPNTNRFLINYTTLTGCFFFTGEKRLGCEADNLTV